MVAHYRLVHSMEVGVLIYMGLQRAKPRFALLTRLSVFITSFGGIIMSNDEAYLNKMKTWSFM